MGAARRGKGRGLLDMETSAIAEVCEQRAIPCSVFRSISDMAGAGTDRGLLRLPTPTGQSRSAWAALLGDAPAADPVHGEARPRLTQSRERGREPPRVRAVSPDERQTRAMPVRGAVERPKIVGAYPHRHAAWWPKPGRFELSGGELQWTQLLRNRKLTLQIDEIRSITLRPIGARTSVDVTTTRACRFPDPQS